jgi:hypothetical protein
MNDGFSQSPDPDCPVCMHSSRAAGSAMVKCGASLEEVAHALQVTPDDVEIHFRDHAPIPPVDPRSASDNELVQLLNDSTELYLQSVLQNNLTAASASLGVRLRTLSEKATREASREKREQLLDGVDPLAPVNSWPDALQKFLGKYFDGLLNRLAERNEVNA